MKIIFVLGMLILVLLQVYCNSVWAAETREFQIIPRGCQVGTSVPNVPNVDVYLDGNFVVNSKPNSANTIYVTTTIGYHNVKLVKNGCAKTYSNVLFEDNLYNLVRLDFCECA
jgi:hypothetical protein